MNIAEHFTKIGDDRIAGLTIIPPYVQDKDKLNQWTRGYIKYRSPLESAPRDLVITGPKLKVQFGGCKWNKIVLAIPRDGETEFRSWIAKLVQKVKSTIFEAPDKFKPGSKSSSRFTFEEDLIKPSSDPERYPDELLQCRLASVRRVMTGAERLENSEMFDPTADNNEQVDADIFSLVDGVKVKVHHTDVSARAWFTPVIRVAYFRHGDKFGLDFIVTKGLYTPNDTSVSKVQNSDWVLDTPDDEPDAKRTKIASATATATATS
jgi:hypothetical protein